VLSEFTCPRIQYSLIKKNISWLAGSLSTSQQGFFSTELVKSHWFHCIRRHNKNADLVLLFIYGKISKESWGNLIIREGSAFQSLNRLTEGWTDGRMDGWMNVWWMTPWSWALLQKPPVVQVLKNFSTFYGTQRFITMFTRALHWSPSWARSIQSILPHPISLSIQSTPSHPTEVPF
jgi:hypothetical protein